MTQIWITDFKINQSFYHKLCILLSQINDFFALFSSSVLLSQKHKIYLISSKDDRTRTNSNYLSISSSFLLLHLFEINENPKGSISRINLNFYSPRSIPWRNLYLTFNVHFILNILISFSLDVGKGKRNNHDRNG